jgi:predicted DNA-binding protein
MSHHRDTVPRVADTEQVQTTVWLTRPMHERLRLAAFTSRLTQSAIVRQALEEWLREHPCQEGAGE